MEARRPNRWRRRDARRRSSIRRLLLWGGITGLVAGLVAQRAVAHNVAADTQYEWLIRGALVLPAVIFFLWWALFPGIALDEHTEEEIAPIPAEERLERIEATFDSAAVPRARRTTFEHVNDGARTMYRGTIRRDMTQLVAERSSFGITRPARRVDATDLPDVTGAAS